MLKIFWSKLITTTTGGAVLIAGFSVVSRLLGLLRDRLLASTFGAGEILDSYYAAFRLPDLIFNTLVFGALAAAFIPVFTRAWLNNKEEAIKLANAVLNYLTTTLLGLSILTCIFAPQIMRLIVPGFSAEQLNLSITLTRIIIFSIVFFGLSNVISGVLNSFKKFFSFSIAPIFYNLGIILGIVVFYPLWGVAGLAWGVVAGSGLHFLIQLIEALKNGWHFQWHWRKSAELKKIFKLMLPRTFALAAGQINQLVITIIASGLAIGSLAVFNLANNLQSFPISVFGISLAIAVFPVFSEALANNQADKFVTAFSLHFRRVLFFIIPISIFILLERAQLVRIILGAEAFDWTATYNTAQTLGWFAISLFAQSLIPMLTRSFYALEDTKTPFWVSLGAVAVNIIFSLLLAPIMGVAGLALAFSLASIFNMIILIGALRARIGYLDDKKIIWSTFKISLNSLSAGLVVYLGLSILSNMVNMQTGWGIFTQGALAASLGVICYLGLSLLFNAEEIMVIKNWAARYLKPIFGLKKNHE